MASSVRADVRLVLDTLPEYTAFITEVDAVMQRIRFRLLLHEGEWLADPRKGLPWRRWVQVIPTPLSEIQNRIRETVRSTPGVVSVRSIKAKLDTATREVSVKVEAQIGRDVVELVYRLSSVKYGNVSPYITYRIL